MKVAKKKNEDIAIAINKEYHKKYTPNYISTIFRQRIIPKINNAAAYHERVVGHLFFEEDFKRCSDCGEMFLICPENFTRKSRAKDGFTNRCKACEKKARNK
jgi:Pyruvate/2-oxoacid:ferredoxin oxidoreductase delta subunit